MGEEDSLDVDETCLDQSMLQYFPIDQYEMISVDRKLYWIAQQI